MWWSSAWSVRGWIAAGARPLGAWRPSVAICQHENLLIRRFELLYLPKEETLAELVAADIASVSPETEVRIHLLSLKDPWDFEEVYGALHDFARAYTFDPETEEYLVHITTGTHVAQICLFLLTESRHLPGQAPAMLAADPARTGGADRHLPGHRPGPVEVRPAGHAFRPGSARGHLAAEVRDQDPQCRVQSAHRPDRTGRRSPATPPSC